MRQHSYSLKRRGLSSVILLSNYFLGTISPILVIDTSFAPMDNIALSSAKSTDSKLSMPATAK